MREWCNGCTFPCQGKSCGFESRLPLQMKNKNDFGIIFWLHLAIIAFGFTSPILLSWKVILLLIILFYVQLLIFGNCILTIKELGNEKTSKTFTHYYLTKLGIVLNEKRITLAIDYVIPWIIFYVALVWQLSLNHHPFLKLSI